MGKKLGAEQWDQFLALVAEGLPIPPAAESLGIVKQAVYMRRSRDPDFDLAVMQAEAKAYVKAWREYEESVANGERNWTGRAWKLERRFKMLHPVDEAKVMAIGADYQNEQQRQRKLRAFIESARVEAEGNPDAHASDPDIDTAPAAPAEAS